MGLKGKRKSVRGDYHASPHADIASKDYHQHISADLPEPLRMRQLLLWSLEKQIVKLSKMENNAAAVKVMKTLEQLSQNLIHRQINVSWYNYKVLSFLFFIQHHNSH